MLSFKDQNTSIRVFRVNHDAEGHVVRERLGVVRKKDFSFDEGLEALSREEKASVDQMIEFYAKATRYELLAALHSMPKTLREVVDFVVAEGSKTEKDMLLMALLEALRIMRKAEKNGADDE